MALLVVALLVALNTRDWVGLEAVVIPPLVFGLAALWVWVCVLSAAVFRQRGWGWAGLLITFVPATLASGWAFLDTTRRILVSPGPPLSHLVLPAALFVVGVLAVAVALAEPRSRHPG